MLGAGVSLIFWRQQPVRRKAAGAWCQRRAFPQQAWAGEECAPARPRQLQQHLLDRRLKDLGEKTLEASGNDVAAHTRVGAASDERAVMASAGLASLPCEAPSSRPLESRLARADSCFLAGAPAPLQLHDAAARGDIELLRRLLGQPGDLEARSSLCAAAIEATAGLCADAGPQRPNA